MYSQEVQFLQRKLADYMKSLQDPIHLAPPKTTLDLEMENGFPVMPEFTDPTNLKKDDLENIIRRYLNVHYSKYLRIPESSHHKLLYRIGLRNGQISRSLFEIHYVPRRIYR